MLQCRCYQLPYPLSLSKHRIIVEIPRQRTRRDGINDQGVEKGRVPGAVGLSPLKQRQGVERTF